MLTTTTYKEHTFLVCDDEGIERLRDVYGIKIEFMSLTCGHYVSPVVTKYSHEETDCPICGTHYKGTGFEGANKHLNGRKFRPKCIHIDVLDTAMSYSLSDNGLPKPPTL